MRTRVVKPEFWRDWKIGGLPREVRLFYIGLWNEADDSGWLRWDPEQLVLDLFPRDGEEVRPMLEDWGHLLQEAGRIRRYKCGHAVIPKLADHQWKSRADKQVHTIHREHLTTCSRKSNSSPRVTAGDRGSPPVELSRVELSRVESNASAHEKESPEMVSPVEVAKLRRLALSSDPAMAKHAQDRLRKAGISV